MYSKFIAARACPTNLSSQKQQKNTGWRSHAAQRGVSLIELMVGIGIGLLVVAVAMGALMVSRGISGTVNDASTIQQQGAYAMRVIGLQLRQAGSLRLNLDPGTTAAEDSYLVPVAFEASVLPLAHPALTSFDPNQATISGTATPVTLTVGYRRYKEPTFTGTAEIPHARNCLSAPTDTSTHQRVESKFEFHAGSNAIRCSGNSASVQPIAQNVANFQVRYLLQDIASTPGIATIKSVDASGVTIWGQVQAVEVCLVIYGDEAINLPAGSNYTDCDGTTQVDMSTLTGARARRMHVAFRNVFQMRSQGLVGSVL